MNGTGYFLLLIGTVTRKISIDEDDGSISLTDIITGFCMMTFIFIKHYKEKKKKTTAKIFSFFNNLSRKIFL